MRIRTPRRPRAASAPSDRRPGRARRVLVTLVGLVLVGAVGTVAVRFQRDDAARATVVTAYFDQTVGLYPGSDVRMLGVPVGTVRSVTPDGQQVEVRLELDDGFAAEPDTGAVIVSPSLVSDRYVQLTKPWKDGPRLASGAVIDRDRTAVPVELDELYESLDDVSLALGPRGANKGGALSDALTTGADNLRGLGPEINDMLRDFSRFGGTLADSSDPLFATVGNLDSFNDELVANDRQVASVNKRFADVTAFLAADRQELAVAITSLTDALARVQRFVRDNRADLASSVKGLTSTAQVLRRQRDALELALQSAPEALSNFLRTYDPQRQVLRGRVDLNEISLWGQAAGAGGLPAAPPAAGPDPGAAAGGSGRTSSGQSPVPLLLPSIGASR